MQRRATKLIPDPAHLDYTRRLKCLKLPSLKYTRLRGDLIQIYNLPQGNDKRKETFTKYFTLASSSSNFHQTRGHKSILLFLELLIYGTISLTLLELMLLILKKIKRNT